MPTITGKIYDQVGAPSTAVDVLIRPANAGQVIKAGANVELGAHRWSGTSVPDPITLEAGVWVVVVSTTQRANRELLFPPQSFSIDLTTLDTISWAAIYDGVAAFEPGTIDTTDQSIAAKVADPASATSDALSATYAAKRVAERSATALRGTPVGNESLWPDAALSNGTVTNGNTRKRHYVIQDMSSVRLLFTNILGRETLPTNNVTVRAGVELPNGTMIPVFFGGKRDVVIEPGGIIASDPVAADFVGGTFIYTRTLVTVASGGKWPMQGYPHALTVSAWGEGCDATNGVTQPDKTTSGTIAANNASHYSPFVVVGVPEFANVPVVGLQGDSIVAGLGDTANVDAGRGFVRRALNNQIAHVSIAASGESLPEPRVLREGVLYGATHVVCNLGINDVKNSRTHYSIRADNLALWFRLARRGLAVYHCTLTPYTTSTDSWATTANQTVTANEANRVSFNDWLRAGAPFKDGAAVDVGTAGATVVGQAGHPLTGYFETADTVETARNSGIWKVGSVYTADSAGIHPSSTGHADMATAIDTALFTV